MEVINIMEINHEKMYREIAERDSMRGCIDNATLKCVNCEELTCNKKCMEMVSLISGKKAKSLIEELGLVIFFSPIKEYKIIDGEMVLTKEVDHLNIKDRSWYYFVKDENGLSIHPYNR